MFLFTSEDAVLDAYIRDHWLALDGLSGESCDIHISLWQLGGEEDAYSQFDEIKSIPGLITFDARDLPALHIWSEKAFVRLRLAPFGNNSAFRDVLRLVFSELNKSNSPLSPQSADELTRKVSELSSTTAAVCQGITNAQAGGDIIQIFNGRACEMNKNTTSAGKSKQTAESVRFTGSMKQTSDAEDATQTVKDASGSDLQQNVESVKETLALGKYSATGKWAIVGLVVISIIVVVFRWLAK